MCVQRIRAAGGFAFLIAACLCVLPACKKKKSSSDSPESSPPPGYPGAKGGPPGGAQSYSRAGAQSSVSNLRKIGLAFHNFNDATSTLPHAIADANGKPGLSWRVAILPYIEQQNLHQQFKLNEPWDSEHNKKLISQMPALYAPPGVSMDGKTYYRSFTGQGAVMPPPAGNWQAGKPFRGLPLHNILDGTANTLMVAEADEPVIWTKPEELPFVPGKPPKLGGGVFSEGFHAILCDGSVRFLYSNKIDARTLSNAIQTNDGQIVDLD
jgi:hypothetical protein